ncbi:MAG: hypothetical protein AAFU57_08030 [Bacteroidota bacterium]
MALPVVQYQSDANSLRVDKNVAFNILSFRDLGDDSKLVKAVLVYTALNHQEDDLFGFYRLDPKKFAKAMFLTESHLYRLHPSPYFLKHDPNAQEKLERERNAEHGRMSEWRTWSTYLENALYILTNQSIVDDYRFKDEQQTVIKTTRFNFFDEITFKLEKSGKTKRIIYYYKPNVKYENNLKQFFLVGEIKKYTQLRKPKLDDAYLNILNRIAGANHKENNFLRFNIDDIAEILVIRKYKRFSDYKAKISEKFERLRSVIGDDIKGLALTWINPEDDMGDHVEYIQEGKKSRYDNVALITWDRLTNEQIRTRDNKIFKNIFDTELTRAFVQTYFKNYEGKLVGLSEDRKKELFYEWFFSEADKDIKEVKYKDTYVEIYKGSKGMNAYAREFLKVLEFANNIQQKHQCISFENDQLALYFKDKKVTFKHLYQLMHHLQEMLKG